MMRQPKYINVGGTLLDLSAPKIMGILNVTPDSFFAASRKQTEEEIRQRARQIISEGAQIIDIGACSTRPGSDEVSTEEEMQRLRFGLEQIRAEEPQAIISVDTYRADIARFCVEEMGVSIINDISGGDMDKGMFKTVAALRVPYVLTHIQGTPKTMQEQPTYEHLLREVYLFFSEKVNRLHDLGVADVVLDPGFGFGKTLEQNYELLHHLEDLQEFDLPILVGVSRKSMIYKLLDTTPEESLNGTSILHTIALMKGANILRVHDVGAAAETIKIVEATCRK